MLRWKINTLNYPAQPVVNWWEAGNTNSAVAAYQPRNAINFSASLEDLSNNLNGAVPIVAPTWNSTDGWTFNGIDQVLDTGLIPTSTWSMLIRFTGAFDTGTQKALAGCVNTAQRLFNIKRQNSSTYICYNENNGAGLNFTNTSGVIGMAGLDCYFDGVFQTSIAGGDPFNDSIRSIYIGALNANGNINNYYAYSCQALAIFNETLTNAQVQAISNAMELI